MDNVTLLKVLEGFNAPLNEEQAWAVCFQCAKHLASKWEGSPMECHAFKDVQSVLLAKDGSVSIRSESTGKHIYNMHAYDIDYSTQSSKLG